MTNFADRERAFEAKYQLDQEVAFRVLSRRDRLLGLWAAAAMGRSAQDCADYAHRLVDAVLERKLDDAALADHVAEDLKAAGSALSRADVAAELTRLGDVAREQILTEA